MNDLWRNADAFARLYGGEPTVTAAAPGRVNLIGEHTDYNDGFVLPMAIPYQTRLAMRRTSSRRIDVATAVDKAQPLSYELGSEAKAGTWADYIQGATVVLAQEGFAVSGFQATIQSDVPIGAGLSSSASLLVALLRGLRELFALPLTDVQVATLSQKVENEFVGAHVGIMDQMAASLADAATALFLDTRDLSYRRIAVPTAHLEFFVIDSGIKHSHAGGEYNARRAECAQACALLKVRQLREITVADQAQLDVLPDLLKRRARHVVTENDRVLKAVVALEKVDGARLGELFYKSHLSMRDDYQITVPGVDQLVALAMAQPHVFGARMTGGGFGGAIVGVAEAGKARIAAQQAAKQYQEQCGGIAAVLVP